YMKYITTVLKRIGFSSSTYLEAITILYKDNGDIANIVPLGYRLRDSNIVTKVYRGSRTYQILISNKSKRGCICVTQDAELFYLSIFDKEKAIDLFLNKQKKVCDAVIEFSIEGIENRKDSIVIYVKPLTVKILRKTPRGFTRASALIIEALIWLTKLPYTPETEREKLVKRIEFCLESINRSSRNKKYRLIAREIYTLAQEYLIKETHKTSTTHQ
ncbi:MAG: DUF447 family protein, partial [Ignisphaera sp.]